MWGREEAFLCQPRPDALKARMTLRTVWSSHPRLDAIRDSRSPLAPSNQIWQRRRTKPSDERRPPYNCYPPSTENGRTNIGEVITRVLSKHEDLIRICTSCQIFSTPIRSAQPSPLPSAPAHPMKEIADSEGLSTPTDEAEGPRCPAASRRTGSWPIR
jgi:hypothetical protein